MPFRTLNRCIQFSHGCETMRDSRVRIKQKSSSGFVGAFLAEGAS